MEVKEIVIQKSRVIRHAPYVTSTVQAGFTIIPGPNDDVDKLVDEVHGDVNILLERLEEDERRHYLETKKRRMIE